MQRMLAAIDRDRDKLQRAETSNKELLAALKLQYCVDCKIRIGEPVHHGEPCRCDEARSAIAKAQGQA